MAREVNKCPLSLMTTFVWILCAIILATPFLFYKTSMSQSAADLFFGLDIFAYIMGFHFLMLALSEQEKFIMDKQVIDMMKSYVDIRWAWLVLKVLAISSFIYWIAMSFFLPISAGLSFVGTAIYILLLTRDSPLIRFTVRDNHSAMLTTNCDLMAHWQIEDIQTKREQERGSGYANLRKMQERDAPEEEWS